MTEKRLAERRCEPCQGGVAPMTPAEAQAMLFEVPDWELVDEATKLKRSFRFGSFLEAQEFAVRVGNEAEAQGHHPDICYGWGYCTVVFYTHKIGGLHENDFIMAARVDRLAAGKAAGS